MKSLRLGRDCTIKLLVVGDVSRWQLRGLLREVPNGAEFVEIAQLDPLKIRQYDSALIVTPLISNGFDACDVAERLACARFKGMFRVVTSYLPDAEIIRDDILDMAPGLDFDLLVLPRADG
ncbi:MULTISPECIES: hypothetical protein [unclassified Yoonia]|uniref:hypothetical protein n=1 Tax=unclassified Yoonia TaxID=2629118 RepID=UPI002B001548|nr:MULTISPECIES: hypothetical protein [unclassified Yoonia]